MDMSRHLQTYEGLISDFMSDFCFAGPFIDILIVMEGHIVTYLYEYVFWSHAFWFTGSLVLITTCHCIDHCHKNLFQLAYVIFFFFLNAIHVHSSIQ